MDHLFLSANQTGDLVQVHYSYDPAEHVTELKAQNGGGTLLADYLYTYDSAGRIGTEKAKGTLDASYSYDAAGQVLADGTRTYSYDALGNRTMAGYVTNKGSGNELQADSSWTYGYDSAGQLTSKSNSTSRLLNMTSFPAEDTKSSASRRL